MKKYTFTCYSERQEITTQLTIPLWLKLCIKINLEKESMREQICVQNTCNERIRKTAPFKKYNLVCVCYIHYDRHLSRFLNYYTYLSL